MIKAVIFDMYETLITHYDCPLYFGRQMAEDAGISEEEFRKYWAPTEYKRSIGEICFEDVIKEILEATGSFSEETYQKIIEKRIATKELLFSHLHKEIIPMMEGIKKSGCKIGLISNCFSEEAKVIRRSVLFPYFDSSCLSYERGIAKPDKALYKICAQELGVEYEECLYVGDGGSGELETARELGMTAVQAVWYLKEGTSQPTGRKSDFPQAEAPLEVLEYIE